MNNFRHKFNPIHTILIIVLLTYSVFIIATCHYERLTGDATIYLSIAEKYIRGDFSNAINGYWGPLLSWLLIPFLYLGSSHLFAINALNLIFGLLTIIGVWRLSYKFQINEKTGSIILLPMIPVLLFISLIEPMDFLLLCILIFYLNVVFRKDYPDRVSHGLFSGVLGACAYFAKPYGLPFFISHFLLINACHYFGSSFKEHKKNVLRNAVAGLVMFSLLSSVWIALISNKYNEFTFSTMGKPNFAQLGPGLPDEYLVYGDPIFYEGFYNPPDKNSFVVYEDPTYAKKIMPWSPLKSWSYFKHFIKLISRNIHEGLRIYESYSRLSITIIIAYILLIFAQPFHKLFSRGEILYPLLTIILYTGGYTLFHFEARYLWIVNILLLLMGGKVLHELFQNEFFKNKTIKNILIVFFILSFILTPIKSFIEIGKKNINKEMYILGTELSKRYNIHGNIASNREKVEISTHDAWHQTFRLAYWLKSRYYGQARENISDEELESELKKYNIDYYFFWGDPNSAPEFLSQYRDLTRGEIPGLTIYFLNNRK
ncbi:MAG: hypothetical protein HZB30_04895 [Nitrospirae bacterium]|nr:hypothetical protein [Nitrospirota bacterium]